MSLSRSFSVRREAALGRVHAEDVVILASWLGAFSDGDDDDGPEQLHIHLPARLLRLGQGLQGREQGKGRLSIGTGEALG